MIIKAITIWQPWSHLKAVGVKGYETRSWPTKYRGPIAIHAAAKPMAEIRKAVPREVLLYIQNILYVGLDKLPLGAVEGIGNLVACHKVDKAFLATLTERERKLGDFTIGRYAWEFSDVVFLDEPIPARGAQGLWNWEDDGLAQHYGLC